LIYLSCPFFNGNLSVSMAWRMKNKAEGSGKRPLCADPGLKHR
jgi:hypothetical protein